MQTTAAYQMHNNEITYNCTLFSVLETVLNCRSNETARHTRRTAEYARILIDKMLRHRRFERELSESDYPSIIQAIPLHDIGKVGIRDDILFKPGALTGGEYAEIQKHITVGFDIVNSMRGDKSMSETALKNCRDVVLFHHERWDGNGYLNGLKKEKIPLAARITAVVDVYDAVTSPRCYKESFPHSKAVEIIKQGRGTHFDPGIVDCFLEVSGQFQLICANLSGGNVFDKLTRYTISQSKESPAHLKRITGITKALTDVMATRSMYRDDRKMFNSVVKSCAFHDIGHAKMTDLLNGTKIITQPFEFDRFKRHTLEGARIIDQFSKNSRMPLTCARNMALYHHEWWNGNGYPFGVKGAEIPLEARIISPVIIYEMLVTKMFKDEMNPHSKALSFIYKNRGIQFDPDITDCFVLADEQIENVMIKHLSGKTA